ncbi:MAG: FtsX-like permease family protein [bacterium]
MDLVATLFFLTALVAAAAVGIAAIRRPILFRMAMRNAMRRPRQTLTVVAGLMIGTAIISSALVAGDSARGAIRSYVYQSLGDVDESVAVQAYPYFPQAVFDAFAADPTARATFDAMAPHVMWQGAAQLQRTAQFEPEVSIIGYDAQRDAGFGVFTTPDGGQTDGRGLQHGEGIATTRLADALGLQVGDSIDLSYVEPTDPILPRVFWTNGTTTSVDPGVLGLPVPTVPPVAQQPSLHAIPVERTATFLAVGIFMTPGAPPAQPPTGLHARLTDPRGATRDAYIPFPGNATRPLLLNVTAAPDATLAVGNWTLEVTTGAGTVQYVGAAIVGYPVYDLTLLQERAKALRQDIDRFKDLLPGLDPFAKRHTSSIHIAAITDGGRGHLFDRPNALFIRLDDAQAMFHREGQVNLIKFSNHGDREEGEAGTADAMAVLNSTLSAIKHRYPDLASVQSLEARPLKQQFLSAADAKGQTLTGLLLFAGALSIITGMLLILNIFTMLAEERRSELGMSRAVGMSRGDLVRLFLFEGSLYAVAAAFVGALIGLGLALGMIAVMNSIISRLSTGLSFPPIEYRPSVGAVLLAFSGGSLLTFATILVASRRLSMLNVVRAIRRIEEPEGHGSRRLAAWVGLPMAVLGIVVAVLGWIANPLTDAVVPQYRFSLEVGGPFIAALGLLLFLAPRWPRRRSAPLLAATLGTYYAATYFAIGRYHNPTEANLVGPIRGVLLTLCVVVLVVHWDAGTRALGRVLARLRPLRAVALPAVSYPIHRKFRTGMTLAMFSVVLLSIGFFSIFGALFQVDPVRQTGGFDIEARPTLVVPDLAPYDQHLIPAGAITAMVKLPEYRTEEREFLTVDNQKVGTFKDYRHVVYGFDDAFVRVQHFRLLERLPQYADDEAAYRGVLAHPDEVIVSYIYSTNEDGQALTHKVGDKLQMHFGDHVVQYTIAGIQEQYHYPGIYLPAATVESLFPGSASLYLIKVAPGTDVGATTKLLEKNYRAVGLDAKDSLSEVLDEQASFRQLLGAMKLFLGLGLVVGVLSLGIITSRNVLERRQEIGMLRALGYTKGKIRLTFFIEVTFTILLGAVVGIACAILVTYGLWFAIVRQLNYPYVIPWAEVGVLVLVSYVVALLATAAPIGRSAKVAPAEALRYLE